MATTQLSGLVSGFDWKTFIDQTIQYASTPITNMQTEQTTNTTQISALNSINTSLTSLQTAVTNLQSATAFSSRTATLASSSSNLAATADIGTVTGAHVIAVSQLATRSSLKGSSDIGSGLSTTTTVSGLTLATLPTATAVTAGNFTVNGQQVTIALSDSLQDVFDKIATATLGHGDVTASYDPSTDKISLTATTGQVVLGAANDTSNFLNATRLANNGTGATSSSTALGTVTGNTPLASAHLRTSITAVDGSGNGSFNINGVSISYNINTDSLNTVIARINASTAGVTASYDQSADRMVLTNNSTGDIGLGANETGAGLLGALGLTGSSPALSRGLNALYTVDGGSTLSSKSNTLTADSHGITGLSITANAPGTDTVTVAADTAGMNNTISTFISAYNAVQALIDSQTKITSANGKVTTSTLSKNREVSAWSQTLRNEAFSTVSGLTGTISRLADLGIDFTSGTSQLAVTDQVKLNNALTNHPNDVTAFFTQASTGFGARMNSFISKVAGSTGTNSYISQQTATLTTRNSNLDTQIANIQRQLDQQRAQLTASFVAMEDATQTQKNMQSQLTNAFAPKTTSS